MLSSTKASEVTTEGIRVVAEPEYRPDHSEPSKNKYLFRYEITIHNESRNEVQLISRHWMIINSHGDENEVRGEGVIGMMPIITPGTTFTYSSFCVLDTPFGTMEGHYLMLRPGGDLEEIEVGRFYLSTK